MGTNFEPDEQRALTRIQQLMNSFMNLTSDGIVVVDVEGRVLEVNKKFEELHGWSKEEVIGQILPMTPEEHKDEVFALYERIAEGEQFSGQEVLKMRKDGSTFYASVTISPIKDDQDRVIAFVGIERDITQKKLDEKELKESEERYRRLLKLSPEPIVLHSDGVIEFVNDIGVKLLRGSSNQDIIGRSIFDFFLPCDHPKFMNRLREVVQTDDFLGFSECKLKRLDGIILDVEISSIYVHKKMGYPIFQTVIRDLTERKITEEYVRTSEKLSIVGQLAAGVAHEIRNPLTALKGFLQLLQAKDTDYVDIMMEEVDRINHIVNEFMAIAKPNAVAYTETRLQPLISSVVQFMQPQALLCDVHLIPDLDESVKPVHCEPNQIKQVIINIIKNAIESMPEGGRVKVSLHASGDGQYAVIRTEDQGDGIPEDKLLRLGEPFFSLKEKGTGLGLMVCRQIIKSHKGEMSIRSQIGIGTTVDIELPYSIPNEWKKQE